MKRLLVAVAILACAGLIHQTAADAATTYKAKSACKLYSKISSKAKTRKVTKGARGQGVRGQGQVVQGDGERRQGVHAEILAAKNVKSKSSSSSSSIRTLRSGNSGSAVKKLQQQLARRGLISKSAVNGRYGSVTVRAIRQYQMMSGLSVSGTATTATIRKLFSSNSRRPSVTATAWSNYSMSKIFPDGGLATIVDLNTGARLRIRRVGGHNHFDVEPAYASATAVLRRMYGGTWSWNSRAVLLIVGGRYIAGAINGMPHGAEISKSNNFNGQFCLHLKGSTTHGSGDSNSAHQSNIRRVYNYFN